MATERSPAFSSYTPAQLGELYREDPDLFRELAAEAIRQACIGRNPEESLRLRQLQWVIDSRLRKGKTPRERLRIMESIFYDTVYGGTGKLSQLIACWEQLHSAVRFRERGQGPKGKLALVKRREQELP